jgi:hypothetical protein
LADLPSSLIPLFSFLIYGPFNSTIYQVFFNSIGHLMDSTGLNHHGIDNYPLVVSRNGAIMTLMKIARKDSRSNALARINLRLAPEVLAAIDAECSRRAGNVSRNTWIIEAVTEKLARHGAALRSNDAGENHG